MTQVASRLNQVQNHKQLIPPKVSTLNRKLKEVVTPPIKEGMVRSVVILVYGRKGSGKSTIINAILHWILSFYGDDVNIMCSHDYLALLDNVGTNMKLVNALVVDDALAETENISGGGRSNETKDLISRWVMSRHELEEATQGDTGIIFEIWASQIYMGGLHPAFRDNKIQIFKSDFPKDKDEIVKDVIRDPKMYELLEEITDDWEIDYNDERRSDAIACLGRKSGLIHIEPYEPWLMTEEKWVGRTDKKKAERQIKINTFVNEYVEVILKNYSSHLKSGKAKDIIKYKLQNDYPKDFQQIKRHWSSIWAGVLSHVVKNKKEDSQLVHIEQQQEDEELVIEIHNVDAEFFNYDVATSILNLPGQYTDLTDEHIILYLVRYYPHRFIQFIQDGTIVDISSLQFDVVPDLAKRMMEEMGANAGIMTGNSISKLFGVSPSTVSNMTGKGTSKEKGQRLIGAIRKDMGEHFEGWVGAKLENGYSLVDFKTKERIIDANEIAQIYQLGGNIKIPDIIVKMKNGDLNIISIKCYDENESITIKTSPTKKDSKIKPEVEYFKYLHGFEIDERYLNDFKKAEVPLELATKDINIRIILLLRNLASNTYLTCKIFNQKDLSDVPGKATFSEGRIKQGYLPQLIWECEEIGTEGSEEETDND